MREAKRTITGRFDYVNTPSEIGQRFGRLLVLERAGTSKCGSIIFSCRCDCGNLTRTWATTLRDGTAKSCGCLNDERRIKSVTKHGHSRKKQVSPEYNSWCAMHARCRNVNLPEWRHYGGRGIKVCERWNDFRNFVFDMGRRPRGTTLDRIRVNEDYEPLNCRWGNPEIQGNNKRNSVFLEFNGRIQTVAQWVRETGLKRVTILGRIGLGWSVEKTLTTPSHRRAIA